ncbi:unnamed protein product [Didymodactylos carnosus]|uniref:Apple domain-containing protein n=1 Tax=Didymodactylos carnosus TaxID=1234261 RepID=A0A8S2F869_9BILA|nr:unnamed protein product [Didymodactylos carnosus]CAF4174505.1 unnamed protein product [Didymodactylos carnosus]
MLCQNYRATVKLTAAGLKFQPSNPIEQLGSISGIKSVLHCCAYCNKNVQCRTFGFDLLTLNCSLYEGYITTGSVVVSSPLSQSSIVGGLVYESAQFFNYNQTCSTAINRYLVCIGARLVCPVNTFWNGSICVNQFYGNTLCQLDIQCRGDLTLICSINSSTCVCNSTRYYWDGTLCALCTYLVCTTQLYLVENQDPTPWTSFSYSYSAFNTPVTLMLSFRNDANYWFIDDVSVNKIGNTTNLIANGGFETGDITGWDYTDPYAASYTGTATTMDYYTGAYSYTGGESYAADFISQTFNVTIGAVYDVSYWLEVTGTDGGYSIVNITIKPWATCMKAIMTY